MKLPKKGDHVVGIQGVCGGRSGVVTKVGYDYRGKGYVLYTEDSTGVNLDTITANVVQTDTEAGQRIMNFYKRRQESLAEKLVNKLLERKLNERDESEEVGTQKIVHKGKVVGTATVFVHADWDDGEASGSTELHIGQMPDDAYITVKYGNHVFRGVIDGSEYDLSDIADLLGLTKYDHEQPLELVKLQRMARKQEVELPGDLATIGSPSAPFVNKRFNRVESKT